MKRFFTVVLTVLAIASWSGKSQAADYEWRMATIDRETGIYWTTIAAKYADLVSQLTNGRMKITPLPAGTVGNIFKLHEAVDDGLVEMANWPPIFLGTADPTNAMIASFPTGLGTDSFHGWLYQGGGQELWVKHRQETMGMHAIIVGSGPSEWFAHSHVAVRTTADLKGLKYRTLGNWAAVVKDKFGAAPTTGAGFGNLRHAREEGHRSGGILHAGRKLRARLSRDHAVPDLSGHSCTGMGVRDPDQARQVERTA